MIGETQNFEVTGQGIKIKYFLVKVTILKEEHNFSSCLTRKGFAVRQIKRKSMSLQEIPYYQAGLVEGTENRGLYKEQNGDMEREQKKENLEN